MLLRDLVETSGVVAATRSRKAKVAAIAERLAQAEVDELPVVTAYLGGTILQRRTGVGWRGLSALPEPADEPTLTVLEVHETLDRLAAMSGPGSQEARAVRRPRPVRPARPPTSSAGCAGVLTGNVRQGALDALVQEAIAAASGVKLTVVRRAAMLAGGTVPIVVAAMTGGEDALAEIGLEVGPAGAADARLERARRRRRRWRRPAAAGTVAVDVKLDGIRIQVHRRGDDVRSRPGASTTSPRGCPRWSRSPGRCRRGEFVLDGEAIALDDDGRPRPVPGDRVAHGPVDRGRRRGHAVLLRRAPRRRPRPPRRPRLRAARRPSTRSCPRSTACRGWSPTSPTPPSSSPRTRSRSGHEGVVVKSLSIGYAAGRRGAGWVKVKPVHTLDLVVLAVEWGSGRREGWLSNIHLGARNPDGTLRDARQDVQGDDRRDARLADRALHRPRGRARDDPRLATSYPCGPSRSSRSPSTVSSAPPATPAASPSASPASSATATTSRADEADTIETVRSPPAARVGSGPRTA